ncbi:MAG TPA: aminotransferase class I/II-fold pyridoxal phosphate-dependent enzyme [Longimicrobiales bacterium]|nr:aminotransferase class I/II-fold pyridoxal phosphate-dependent enzyme [Longimicrobiales bacterium]
MSTFRPFEMERWQSIYENQVAYNLSESGVHPLSLRELIELSGAHDLLNTGLGYGQSNGTDQLRARIAALYDNCSDKQIVVTNGSAEANFIALWQLAEAENEVAIIVPTYMQTYGLAQSFGVAVREIWLQEDNNWQPSSDDIRENINDKTRVVVVTNPNNPTGARLSEESRRAIIDAAAKVGAWILADEVYAGAEFDGVETRSLALDYDRVIATGSLSKAYGLPGLRIGWAVAPEQMADALWARKDYMTISPGELTDRIATVALDPAVRPRIIARTRGYLQGGFAILEDWMNATGIFQYRAPDAGAICYARYNLDETSSELAERLRADQSVLIVPGDHFGMEKFLRIGFGNEPQQLKQALQRFGNALI